MKGPFDLGPTLSRAVAAVAVAWILAITVFFVLPTTNPVSSQTFNYTVVAVGIIAVGSIVTWLAWARTWFTGPAAEVTEAMRLGVDLLEPRVEENESEKGEKTGDDGGN